MFLISLFFLVSCASGSKYLGKEYFDLDVRVEYKSQEEILKIAENHGGTYHGQIRGYTIWDGRGRCDIFIVPREAMFDLLWERLLGHEMRHCLEHNFHD